MNTDQTARIAALLAETAQTLALVAAELTGDAPAKAAPKPKASPKATKTQPATLVAAKSHCYEARMTRRANTKLGGLTKAERSALWAANPQIHSLSATARRTAWNKLVAAAKAA